MVRINKIYTRTGDDGTTGLVGGERRPKDSTRVAAFGDVDELNATLGIARTHAEELHREQISSQLMIIQNELFDLGSELATPASAPTPTRVPCSLDQILRLEQWIDQAIEGLPELQSFVLPGGSQLNAFLHLARTVCRRAERSVLTLSREETVNPAAITYLNRLSDYLFAAARRASAETKIAEFLWEPGSSRLSKKKKK